MRLAQMPKKFILAATVAAMLTACGGGDTAATPQQAAGALQAVAKKSSAIPKRNATLASAEIAAKIFAFAEGNLPGYFPSTQPTNTAGPFLYRFYPETGLYLGVAVVADAGYELNGVYVLGGDFGMDLAHPFYAGPASNYVDTTDGGGGGGGGTDNGCFDLALADTQGTTIDINYQYTGVINGSTRVLTTVGGMTTFEGQSARATEVATSGTGDAAALAATGTSYSLRDGDTMRHFGSQFVSSFQAGPITVNTTIKTVYNPPYVDTQYTLAQGASVTLTQSGKSYMTSTFSPNPTETDINSTTTYTYVGDETVTVPAGTFTNACKYTMTTSGSNEVTTTWYVKGKGLPVKITTTAAAQVIEATSAKVNGSAVQ